MLRKAIVRLGRAVVGYVALAALLMLAAPPASATGASARPAGPVTAAACGNNQFFNDIGFLYDPAANRKHVNTDFSNNARLVADHPVRALRYKLFYCFDFATWAISDVGNGKFISAEINLTGSNYGLLRARADTVGQWEQYDLMRWSTFEQRWIAQHGSLTRSGTFTLRAHANGRYVSAEFGWDGRLRARAGGPGSWETFVLS